ncbi:hypothetical protein M9458_041390, partial [Cirrhinus mrigala]
IQCWMSPSRRPSALSQTLINGAFRWPAARDDPPTSLAKRCLCPTSFPTCSSPPTSSTDSNCLQT